MKNEQTDEREVLGDVLTAIRVLLQALLVLVALAGLLAG